MERYTFCRNEIECIFLSCSLKQKTFIIGCVYRAPDGDKRSFLGCLETILLQLRRELPNAEYIVLGDFNINLLDNVDNGDCEEFINLMASNNLLPLITKPTRINDGGGNHSLLDNVFYSDPVSYISGILISSLSDHYPVFCLCKNVYNIDNGGILPSNKVKWRVINDATLDKFCNSLIDYDFTLIYAITDVNLAFVAFEKLLIELYNTSCPIVTKDVSYKEFTKPWVDNDVKREMRIRDSYLRLYRGGRIRKSEYCRQRNKVTGLLRERRKAYFANQFECVKGDIKRTWSLINNVIKPNVVKKRGNIKELRIGDDIVCDSKRIANEINNFFSTIGSSIANSLPPPNFDYRHYLRGDYVNSFFLPLTTTDDVLSYINSLKKKKCSVNCLPSIVLERISYIVAPVLSHLINLSIDRGIFPDCLKLARVVPLFKGGDSANVSNYRPISVLKIISKILEKHAFRHLYSYFESRSIISESQFGFRYGRGTTQAILNHCSYIYENLDENKLVFSIYLDFMKAFDSVDHEIGEKWEICLKSLHRLIYGLDSAKNQYI